MITTTTTTTTIIIPSKKKSPKKLSKKNAEKTMHEKNGVIFSTDFISAPFFVYTRILKYFRSPDLINTN